MTRWRARLSVVCLAAGAGLLFSALLVPQLTQHRPIQRTAVDQDDQFLHSNDLSPLEEVTLVDKDDLWRSWPECLCGAPEDVECTPLLEPPEARHLEHGAGGTCSWRAARYSSRNVISTVLYGSPFAYEAKLQALLRDSAQFYPGWSLWIYQRHPHPKYVCSMLKKKQSVFFCDTRHLPALGDLKRTSPLMWKVAPLGDPRVSAVFFRNAINELTDREASAVLQWFESGKTWHVMRDHPSQTERVVDGLWCARWNYSTHHNLAAVRNIILARSFSSLTTKEVAKFASDVLWSQMESSKSLMQHDAFRCHEAVPGSFEPWPSRRRGLTFVGMSNEPKEAPECPAECRPPAHPEWTAC